MTDETPAAPETGAAPLSLRDTLNATFEKAQSGTLEAPDVADRSDLSPAKADGEKPAVDRARDPETGKFIPKADAAEEAKPETPAKPDKAEPPAAAPVEAKAASSPADVPAAPSAAVEPPQHWPQADRDMFAKMPKDLQEWAIRRDKEMESGFTKKWEPLAPLAKIVDVGKDYFATLGLQPIQAIQNLLQAEYTLRHGTAQEKAAIVKQLDRDYGISSLLPGSASPQIGEAALEAQPDIDPVVSALSQKVAELESQSQQWKQQQEAAEQARLNAEINAFKDEKDASGKPLRPHFDAVRQDMALIEQAARAGGQYLTLKDIYDRAVYANPTVRAQLLDEQSKEQQRKIEAEAKAKRDREDAEAKAKAEKAAKAASSISGAPRGGASQGSAPKASIRDNLNAAFAQHSGGRV